MFEHPIEVVVGETIERDGFVFADLLPRSGCEARSSVDLPRRGFGYCVSAHTVPGKAHGLRAEEILRIRDGDRASPGVGLTDPAILEVIAAVGVRALVNALALASATEIDWPKPPRIPES